MEARAMTREQIVHEYDTLLRSYARFCELGRQSPRMEHVEYALVSLVGQMTPNSPAWLVALAGVSGTLAALYVSHRELPSPQIEYRCKCWQETRVAAARQSAEWLCRQTPGCVRLFRVPRHHIESRTQELLTLLDEHFSPRCMDAYKRELREIFEQYDAARRLGKARNVAIDDDS